MNYSLVSIFSFNFPVMKVHFEHRPPAKDPKGALRPPAAGR